MNNVSSRLLYIFLLLLTTLQMHAQICPNAELQRQMQIEERSFLASMKPGLQHKQMLAVRAAIQGDDAALQQIRRSRNQASVLPQGVNTSYPQSNLCLYTPTDPSDRPRPLLLYLHGGGWCFGSINSCSRFCAALALEANCCVAALDYSLAPASPFPAPLADCQQAFAYLRAHAAEWGCDSARVSVGGDSAGGSLALATALSVPGVNSVIPIYPVTELFTRRSHSWRKYGKGYGNDAELLEAFNDAYAQGQQHHPLVSVGLSSDSALQSLPPVLILSAGHDILFDQTAQLARRLQKLHHPLAYHVFPTATHLFITVPGQPTAFSEAVRIVARFLNEEHQAAHS